MKVDMAAQRAALLDDRPAAARNGIALIEAFPRELHARLTIAGSLSPVDLSTDGDESEAASMVLAELDEPGTHKIDVGLFPKVHFRDPPRAHQHLRCSLSGATHHVLLLPVRSDRHNLKGWIESAKIIRIGRDGLLTGSASANHNVTIHNIGGAARSK